MGRRFDRATAPDEVWYADITYVPTWERWRYLALVIDAYSRRIVGWSMRESLQAELVTDALGMALTSRRPRAGAIHHSDRGSQYGATVYGRTLSESGLLQSMGARASALDNAACESAIATFKTELVHRRSFRTRDSAREEVFRWLVGWYDARRRHSSLGYLSPDQFEQKFHDAAAADVLSGDPRASERSARVLLPPDHGPCGPVDPDRPGWSGAVPAGVEPLPESPRVSTEGR